MISPKLYKNSRFYDFFIKALGYQSSIDRFLNGLDFDCPSDCRILDAGCGTGLLGLHFLSRFPDGQLHSTDLEPNFLHATLANAKQRGLDESQIHVGVADISNPAFYTTLDGEQKLFEPQSLDLICIGAVVGYSKDIEESVRSLVRLLAPGGSLVNVEMNESISGKFVSQRYHYHNISLERMLEIMREEGCQVDATRFSLRHLPAKFTRTGIVARRPR